MQCIFVKTINVIFQITIWFYRKRVWKAIPRFRNDYCEDMRCYDFSLAFSCGYLKIDQNVSSRISSVEMISDQRRCCRQKNSYRS